MERYVSTGTIDLVPTWDGRHPFEEISELTDDYRRELVRRWVLEPAIDDLIYQKVISWLSRVKYLTDWRVDAELRQLL